MKIMPHSDFLLLPPTSSAGPLHMPWVPDPPAAVGRRLANGLIVAVRDTSPDLFYKFTPWTNSTLAWNEVDICAAIRGSGGIDGVVRMEGISATRDHLVRVMERSHAGSLEGFLRGRKRDGDSAFDAAGLRSFLADIAAAMARLHRAGVVHRDLKAENILLFGVAGGNSGSPQAKVSDFDRAVLLSAGTKLNEPVGSLFHMAPELLAWQPYDWKVDVYAFAILMFEVLHEGARPYDNVATGMPGSLPRAEFADRVVNEDYRPVWRHADPGLQALAARCWSADPTLRPDFDEISAILGVAGSRMVSVGQGRTVSAKGSFWKVGVAGTIGKVRRRMEDAASVLNIPDALICGVFDGFRGPAASEAAARSLPLMVAHALRDAPEDAADTLLASFEAVQVMLRRMDPIKAQGSTATLAVVDATRLTVAWAGDSPAWLFRRGRDGAKVEAVALIKPHHPDREEEAARITSLGGEVRRETRMLDSGEAVPWGPLRVFNAGAADKGGIALSRALGLASHAPVISSAPDIVSLERNADDLFLVIGSDGVFEVLSPHDICGIIEASAEVQKGAEAVIDAVLQAGAPDNACIAVIDLS